MCSLSRAHRFTRELRADIVWANDFNALGIDRPFGGVKGTGTGTGTGRDKCLQALVQYTTQEANLDQLSRGAWQGELKGARLCQGDAVHWTAPTWRRNADSL